MAWFDFLEESGYFDPDKNPEPLLVKEGFQIPYWEALSYLEKLSDQIRQGKELELIDKVLSVIENVSKHPKDNYRTWYAFVKILGSLPNEKVSANILNFIPVWLSGRFDTMLQTSELCDKLLPKFLNEKPTSADVTKAELILHHLFHVQRVDKPSQGLWDGEGERYRSRAYLHFLANKLEKGDLISKIVSHCSINFMLELGRTLKFLLLDYPNGIQGEIKHHDEEYAVKIYVEEEDLLVLVKHKDKEESWNRLALRNWEDKKDADLKKAFISLLEQQGINYSTSQNSDDIANRLIFGVRNDLMSAFGFTGIRELDDKFAISEKELNVFSLIFRDLLDEEAKQKPKEAMALLRIFCNDPKYSLPFYKRIALYVIAENWSATKSFFWEMVGVMDESGLFSNYKYQKELYDLLARNQQSLTEEEKTVLYGIIDQGQKDKNLEDEEKQKEYWQLRWYSALKDIEPFQEKYLTLSNALNLTSNHYVSEGKIRWRSGSISPLSKDELLRKSNAEIVHYIKSFKPKDRWEDPSISGLSETLGSAVEEEPEKFAQGLSLYHDLPYIYTYRMLNAFDAAWKKKKEFNWENVLHFCLQTLKNDDFYSEKLKTQDDSWNATADWVVGSIAHLLTTGLQDDKNAFEPRLLPVAKEILEITIYNLKKTDDFKESSMDYPMYSLNSTAGKSLRALLDYALRRARSSPQPENGQKWESDIKNLFESTIEKGILDGHILEGMYFEQFYFLDSDWIVEQIRNHYHSGDREWLALMSGFVFSNPPFNEAIYTLFYPHYERAIETKVNLETVHHRGLVRHLTAFYFWKYETLSSKKLLYKFLNASSTESVGNLIRFIWQQEDYQKQLLEIEKKEFQQMILELWQYLTTKYEGSKIEEEQKNLAALASWIVFAPDLNEAYADLIAKSAPHVDKIHNTHELLENLFALIGKSNPFMEAKYVGEILLLLNFQEYMADFDKDLLRDFVSFLFQHGQKSAAVEFCNKMASIHQLFFLRDIYEANVTNSQGNVENGRNNEKFS